MSEIFVTIDWIRHGFSCANILQYAPGTANVLRPLITSDAALSKTGVEQAILLNNNVKNDYDIICCSHLRRAMETALYGFNNLSNKQTLIITPYISEVRHPVARMFGLDQENQSLGIDMLEKHWNELKSQFNFDVDFSIIKNPKFNDYDREDYDKFVKLALPEIIKLIDKVKKPVDNHYKIAIVSHSHFIHQHIKKNHKMMEMKELKNTEAWREKLDFIINPDNTGMIKDYVIPDKCDNKTCQIYPGKNPDCGEILMDRCKKYQHSMYNKFVPDTINIQKCDIETKTQNGGTYNYKYIRYKQNISF